jgi:hemoglobin
MTADITDAQIPPLLADFYRRVRADALLGPVFGDAVADWPDHVSRLADFWSSVMLTSGRYKRQPMAAHVRQLERIMPPMFDRWLAIWADTTRRRLSIAGAAAMQDKAARISISLQAALRRAQTIA